MADNYCLFSETYVIGVEEYTWLKRQLSLNDHDEYVFLEDYNHENDNDKCYIGFEAELSYDPMTRGGFLVVYAEEHGAVDRFVHLFQKLVKQFPAYGAVCFQFVETCSKPRPGEFGGGAYFIAPEGTQYMSTGSWLAERRSEYERQQKTSPEENPGEAS